MEDEVVAIDAQEVEFIDTASLQVLYALATYLKKRGAHLDWHKPSQALLVCAEKLGMADALGLVENEQSQDQA